MDKYDFYRDFPQTNIKKILDQLAFTGLQYREQVSAMSHILEQINSSYIDRFSSQSDIIKQLKLIKIDSGSTRSDIIGKNNLLTEINTQFVSNAISSISRSIKIADLAQSSLQQLYCSENLKSLQIHKDLHKSLYSSFFNLSISYSNLTASVEQLILEKPLSFRIISELPALEVLNNVEILETVSTPEKEKIEDELKEEKQSIKNELSGEREEIEKLLIHVGSPDLVPMWQGAKAALNSTENPDYARHCAVSLRELFTQIIHRLSPDNEMKKWSENSDNKELFQNGKPTRKARLLYICRSVNHDIFSDFIEKDVDAILEIVNLFQRGTHQVTIPFTHKQLIALQARIESAINFLIEIWQLNE
ncbi:hypothetical protein SD81_023090 [Tolypothrix campylonemoides VB511288]|nr:hypothetical protein SD81_023090 [Tolypothrix campylonemoides VB511288]